MTPLRQGATRGAAVIALWWIFALLLAGAALARDDAGRFAQNPNHEWVQSLHSPAGTWCCDISDGRALLDADWRSQGGHYQVKLEEGWIDVPESAVIGEPNRIGQTIVWFGHRDGKPIVNCFLPGSMT